MPAALDTFVQRLAQYLPALNDGAKLLGREFDADRTRMYDFFDDFELAAGATLKLPWVKINYKSGAGTPTNDYVNDSPYGAYNVVLHSTNEAEGQGLYFGDQNVLYLSNNTEHRKKNCYVEFVAKITPSVALAAGDEIVFGVTGDRGAGSTSVVVLDNIAVSAWFRISGTANAVNIYCESDDGTTDKNLIDTGFDIASGTTATRIRGRIDFSDVRDVKFYLQIEGNATCGKGLVRVCSSTTFDMSGGDFNVQPYWEVQKSSGTQTHTVKLDLVGARGERLLGVI